MHRIPLVSFLLENIKNRTFSFFDVASYKKKETVNANHYCVLNIFI